MSKIITLPGMDDQMRHLLEMSQKYADQGDYEQAVAILDTIDCLFVFWQKGKIYLQAAESMHWLFKNYETAEVRAKYEKLLLDAWKNFDQVSLLLPQADSNIKVFFNQHLWSHIAKVEYALVQLKPSQYQDTNIMDDEGIDDFVPDTDDLIEDMCFWSL